MRRIIIFGAGGFGMRYANDVLSRGEEEIVCFLDNSKAKQGTKINGIDVFAPEKIGELEYTVVAVVTLGFEDDIVGQLKELGVDETKIIVPCPRGGYIDTRTQWLGDFANMIYSRGIAGNVAEAGVFRGDFARRINAAFPDKTLYLFDTFEGFPSQDVAREELPSNAKAGYYDFTNEELVLSKLPHPANAVIKKGYFPETAQGLDNLDSRKHVTIKRISLLIVINTSIHMSRHRSTHDGAY